MIILLKEGKYQLIESKRYTKILTLDGCRVYTWSKISEIFGILEASHKELKVNNAPSPGKYRIYEVANESELTGPVHLELFVGEGKWQGYLLPEGFPKGVRMSNRIIPTDEIITKSLF